MAVIIEAPAGPSVGSSKNIDDLFASSPLFMQSLPEGEENDAVAALQSLAYDGTPDEIALNFKEHGNDCFSVKQYREAIGFYTQGIDVKPDDKALFEVLYVNRAACNLALKNNRKVLHDCSAALELNPRSVKALYRSSLALLALEQHVEAIDCCERALAIPGGAGNKPVQTLLATVRERQEKADRKHVESTERARREKEGALALNLAFGVRGIHVQKTSSPPDNPYPPHFDEECVPEDSMSSIPLYQPPSPWIAPSPEAPLIFPVFLLYPSHGQSDLISLFEENTAFADHLDAIFATPPPWDTARAYRPSNVVVYCETAYGRLLKIPRKMALRSVFEAARGQEGKGQDGVVLKDGLLSFVVLVKGEEEKAWVAEAKKKQQIQSTS